MKTEIRRVFKR